MPNDSEPGNLYITVADGGGIPLPGVMLTIMHQATRLERVTVTNEVGQGRFRGIPPSRYLLRAELEGFHLIEKPDVNVHAGQATVIEITLELAS